MQFHNPNDTIHVPPQDIFEDLLDQVEKLQTQVDELKRLNIVIPATHVMFSYMVVN
ncbi:hypothetical protein AB0Y31_05335 [Lactobacillus crispatus]|uniref:hypothetical protein n=1 Tax=Lactobacillus crispatus TaxID=47770 RepID=UPI003F2673A2